MPPEMKYVRLGSSGLKVSRISKCSIKQMHLLIPSAGVYVLRLRYMGKVDFK